MPVSTALRRALCCAALLCFSACATAPQPTTERAPWYDEPAVEKQQVEISASTGPAPERRSGLTICDTSRILHGLYMVSQNPNLADVYFADWLKKPSAKEPVE